MDFHTRSFPWLPQHRLRPHLAPKASTVTYAKTPQLQVLQRSPLRRNAICPPKVAGGGHPARAIYYMGAGSDLSRAIGSPAQPRFCRHRASTMRRRCASASASLRLDAAVSGGLSMPPAVSPFEKGLESTNGHVTHNVLWQRHDNCSPAFHSLRDSPAAHWLRHSLTPIGPSTVLYETPGLDGLMGWNARRSHLHPRGDKDLSPQAFPFGTSHLTRADVPFTVTLSWRDFSRQWPCPVVGGWDVSITLRSSQDLNIQSTHTIPGRLEAGNPMEYSTTLEGLAGGSSGPISSPGGCADSSLDSAYSLRAGPSTMSHTPRPRTTQLTRPYRQVEAARIAPFLAPLGFIQLGPAPVGDSRREPQQAPTRTLSAPRLLDATLSTITYQPPASCLCAKSMIFTIYA
ncbi:hypothetical protein BKA56DRAFT_614872 [Ilyonectria sp. MPI-CAGE-AT-0026]|nr:hypothetical protein BKA56DRAFT_614872 [Ilyonectria sp. MPI-CAGE-AT-0026]